MDLRVITPATGAVLDLGAAKAQVRRDDADEDEFLTGLVRDAGEYVEIETRRQLLPATYELVLPGFPCGTWIEMPRPPLQSVTSIGYVDVNGGAQTLDTGIYRVQAPNDPRARRGRVELVDGTSWPSTARRDDAVTIRFVAGYGDAASVPAGLQRAIKLLVSHWYENRETTATAQRAEIPYGVVSLCSKFRSRPLQYG